MRLLRWKARYNTGEAEIDKNNKKFVECVNRLIEAADEREHCQEMEVLLNELSQDVTAKLAADKATALRMTQTFYAKLLNTLPLQTYGTNACRKCGLCDLAQAQLAEHLQAPLQCLSQRADNAQ